MLVGTARYNYICMSADLESLIRTREAISDQRQKIHGETKKRDIKLVRMFAKY